MNSLDWFILGTFLISALLGLVRGFVREAVSLATWLLAVWLAWTFAYLIEPHLGGVLAQPHVKVWVARLVIFIAVLLVGALIAIIMAYFIRHSPFGGADRFMGLLFGLLRAAVLVGLAVIVGQLLQLDDESWWRESRTLPYAGFFGEWIHHLVDDVI